MNPDETSIPEESNWPLEESSEAEKRQPLPELKTLGTFPDGSSAPSQTDRLDSSQSDSSQSDAIEPENPSEELADFLPDRVVPSESVETDSEGWPDIGEVEETEKSSSLETEEEAPISPPETATREDHYPKEALQASITDLERHKAELEAEVNDLENQRERLIASETTAVQEAIARMILNGTKELEERREILQQDVEKLEKRRDRAREEMSKNFSGVSQDIAIRVQSFKNYLVGSLQELAETAEQLNLPESRPSRELSPRERRSREERQPKEAPSPQFAKQSFKEQQRQVSSILDRYRTRPDYYGPPWQLRRTFEPIHAERVQQWFFKQGGRGTTRSMGSRLQNILIASAAISVLRHLYDDRLRVLVLANTPERVGEWRRGLQDCLGISRGDFGPKRGISLFESPEALVQKADRFVEEKQLPMIIMDETEDLVNLSLLQFPLWLAFAPDPTQISSYVY
ncbi:MAG: DUF3086 domain-containing protein [Cyanobacteria bacterium SBLK]|nr:DUF3086 domain-containing protein [Cyanobacteria bacterium SBLK]